jgi:hypothetical protein
VEKCGTNHPHWDSITGPSSRSAGSKLPQRLGYSTPLVSQKENLNLLFHVAEWLLLYKIVVIFMTLHQIKDYHSIKTIPLQKASVVGGCGVRSNVMISLYQFPAEP